TAGLWVTGPGGPAAAVPADQDKAPPAAAANPFPLGPTCAVTFTGTATGPDGRPVAGATIYLTSSTPPLDKPLATTTTDVPGSYAFRDVAVPMILKHIMIE